jgi:hypothetical protein
MATFIKMVLTNERVGATHGELLKSYLSRILTSMKEPVSRPISSMRGTASAVVPGKEASIIP